MEDLLAESKIELLKEGSVISGTVMEIRPTEVVIDFGGKAEGTIPAHEFLDLILSSNIFKVVIGNIFILIIMTMDNIRVNN